VAEDGDAEVSVLRWLASRKPLHIRLQALDQSSGNADRTLAVLQKAGILYQVAPSLLSPFVDLRSGFEHYEQQLSRKLRTEIRRRRRRLEELGHLDLDVSDGTRDLTGLLAEGFRVEGDGWKDAHATSINARPKTRRFYEDIAEWATGRGSLRLAYLRLDQRPIAFDLCLEDTGVHYLLKTGFDHDFRRFGPGMLLRYLMIQRAFGEGLSSYEFLGTIEGANNAWKHEWTASVRRRIDIDAFAPTLWGRIDRAARVGGQAARRGGLRAARRLLSDASRDRVKSTLGKWRSRR
jgi:CelD/BcsL family acetyltransferase involved in cellulose biosynthesis